MDKALCVCGSQPSRRLVGDAQDFGQGERPLAIEPGLQRLAGDELHHQKWRRAVRFDVVNRHDVLMYDSRRRSRLAGKSLSSRAAAGQVWGENFDGDWAVQLRVERLE